ncbi:unnamed protein product [Mytilus edulis]|uniref:Sushi domain-containing protein n=1 Tax=Mytilus edulis TaxID=6550 RepID=A0A8S3T9F1_MYTED|nr:unnamed protein product [Mytilus edulis]
MNAGLQMVTLYILLYNNISEALKGPSFVSDWKSLSVDDPTTDIRHNLGAYPLKVDVQILVTKEGVDYIFTGSGAAQRDDDKKFYFGGVIYIYNTEIVKIIVPEASTYAGIAYTGSSLYYNGGAIMWFTSGKVRVRLWTANDFPLPDFSARTTMDANQLPTFRELTHGLGQYPNMVTVRIELDDGFMSDGQGSTFTGKPEHNSCYSGLLYGYNETMVRLWVPYHISTNNACVGTVCCANDGWSTSKIEYSGTVHVLAWILDEENHDYDSYYQNISIHYATNPVLLPTILNIDDFFVTVEVDMLSGDNSGYRFQTAGSAMTNSNNDFGELVYAYSNSSVQIWVPNEKGHVQFVGNDWGGGVCSSREDAGHLVVKIFTFRDNKTCGIPASYPFSTLTYTDVTNNSIALYTCTNGYTLTSGDLVHQCMSPQWIGDPPSCQGNTQCLSPKWIGNPPSCEDTCGIPTSYPFSTNTYSHLTNNSFAIYSCKQGYEMISGDTVHQCFSPKWIGTPPNCHESCGIPISYPFSTKSFGHVTNNSFVLYKCLHGYSMASGDPIHTCISTRWIGIAPYCKESCGTPPSYDNTTYSYDDTVNGSIAVYKCKGGYFIHLGDTLHECKPPEWTGYPLECSNELTLDAISKLKEDIKKELLVDRKSTTAYINSKTSAADPRPSSRAIGTVGVVFLTLCLSILLLLDMIQCEKYRQMFQSCFR